jgi:hypothetical protein
MKVKLKMSSSSFERRSKKVGLAAEGGTSGSCVDRGLARARDTSIISGRTGVTYLYIFNRSVIAWVSLRYIPDRRERVRGEG